MINKEGYNKSFLFLLPIISQYLSYNHKYFDSLIDTFIFDSKNNFKNCILLKYKFNLIKPEFKKYEYELTENQLFLKKIDIGDNTTYVFKFPINYLKDYNLFIEGKYSQLSKAAKDFILEFWGTIPNKYSWKEPFLIKLQRIFTKDKKLREYIENQIGMKLPEDAELASTIYNEHETYNYD